MAANDLGLLVSSISNLLASQYGGAGNRADNDFDDELLAVTRGDYRFQVRCLPTGMYHRSNQSHQVATIEITVAYRIDDGETVGDYAAGTAAGDMLGRLEYFMQDSWWHDLYYVLQVQESFVATEITVVGDVVAYTIQGSVVVAET